MANTSQLSLDWVRAEMSRTNEIFHSEVFAKRNFDALDDVYTENARILPPGAPMISGRPAIKQFWAGAIQSMNATAALLTSLHVMPSGNEVVEIGVAKLTIQPKGDNLSEIEAKYVVYWREENQRWKWHVDIWNANA